MIQIDLSGKVILLTGASRGIGAGIARLLAQAGATLALQFRHNQIATEGILRLASEDSRSFQADLSQANQSHQLVKEVENTYGRLDVLINNAGVAYPEENSLSNEEWQAVWEKTLQTNLTASAALSRHAIKQFEKQKSGSIIFISSRAAFRGDTPEYMAYAASKAGMVALSRSIARGYGKSGIKSFVIAPGFTETDMAQDFIDTYGRDYVRSDLALDELTQPEDIAPTVLLMASGLMDHATGCTVDINAGSYVR